MKIPCEWSLFRGPICSFLRSSKFMAPWRIPNGDWYIFPDPFQGWNSNDIFVRPIQTMGGSYQIWFWHIWGLFSSFLQKNCLFILLEMLLQTPDFFQSRIHNGIWAPVKSRCFFRDRSGQVNQKRNKNVKTFDGWTRTFQWVPIKPYGMCNWHPLGTIWHPWSFPQRFLHFW